MNNSLPNTNLSTKPEHSSMAQLKMVQSDTSTVEVSLPASTLTSNVSLPDYRVSEISFCPEQEALPLPVTVERQIEPISDIILPQSDVLLSVEIHSPSAISTNMLSASADEFLPVVIDPTTDTRPYPPGITSDGVEWTHSDTAWIALEYGNQDVSTSKPDQAAKPDLNDTRILKTLEVKLPNGGIFDDKVLPTSSSEIVPNATFSKEYFLDLNKKVRQYGTYNYAGAKVKLEHSKLNIELFRQYQIMMILAFFLTWNMDSQLDSPKNFSWNLSPRIIHLPINTSPILTNSWQKESFWVNVLVHGLVHPLIL